MNRLLFRRRHSRSRFKRIKVNHHAHTCASDGCDAALRIAETAREKNIVLGITDHNTVESLRVLLEECLADASAAKVIRSHILPGIEVQSRSGAELLVYGETLEAAIAFHQEVIKPSLSTVSPLYDPVNIDMPSLIRACMERGMYIVIPHFALKHFGFASLSKEELQASVALLRRCRGRVAIEHNPHLFPWQNSQASLFAMQSRFPVITGADSHDSIHHRSFTKVRPDPRLPVTRAYFEAIHARRPRVRDRHTEIMSKLRSIKHGSILLRNMGVLGIFGTLRRRGRYAQAAS